MFVVRPSVRAINSGSSTITISTLQLDEIKRSQRMLGPQSEMEMELELELELGLH